MINEDTTQGRVCKIDKDTTQRHGYKLDQDTTQGHTCKRGDSHTFLLNSHVIQWTSKNTSHPDDVCDNHLIASHMRNG